MRIAASSDSHLARRERWFFRKHEAHVVCILLPEPIASRAYVRHRDVIDYSGDAFYLGGDLFSL